MNNLLRRVTRKQAAQEYPSENPPVEVPTTKPFSSTEKEEPTVAKASRRFRNGNGNGFDSSMKSGDLSQGSTGPITRAGTENDTVVNGLFQGSNAPGASFSISQPSISPYGSLGLPQPLAATNDNDDNNSIFSKGPSRSRHKHTSQTIGREDDGGAQASWKTLGEGESMASSRLPHRSSSRRRAHNTNNKSASLNPSTSRSEQLSDVESDPSRTLRGAKAVLRRHANHAPSSMNNRSSRSQLLSSERRRQSPNASSAVIGEDGEDGMEPHVRTSDHPRIRHGGRTHRKASSNNSKRSSSNSQLPRDRTSPTPLVHLTLNSSAGAVLMGGDPSTNTAGSSIHHTSDASTMRPVFTDGYVGHIGGNNKSSFKPPSCASTTAFQSVTTRDDDFSTDDDDDGEDAEEEREHEKNLDQLMQHLARYAKSPTPVADSSRGTSVNDEDGAGTSSWAGVGGSGWSSHAASLRRSGSEVDTAATTTTTTTPTTGWTGVGGVGLSSDDWYTRMRQKAKDEEEKGSSGTVVNANANANTNNTVSILTPVVEETSTDWYARMRQKVKEEEREEEKKVATENGTEEKKKEGPVPEQGTPAALVTNAPPIVESSEDWYARMRRKVQEEEKRDEAQEKATQEGVLDVAKSEGEAKEKIQATVASATAAAAADVTHSTPTPPNLSTRIGGERYRRPEPPRRPRRPPQVAALPSDLSAAKEQLARSDVLPCVSSSSSRPELGAATGSPGPALAPTSPDHRTSWYGKPTVQTRRRSSTTSVSNHPGSTSSLAHSNAMVGAGSSSNGGGSAENMLPAVVGSDGNDGIKTASGRASSEVVGRDVSAMEWNETNRSGSINVRNSAGENGKVGLSGHISSASGRNSSTTITTTFVNQRRPSGQPPPPQQHTPLLQTHAGDSTNTTNSKMNGDSANHSPNRLQVDSPKAAATTPTKGMAGMTHRTQGTLVYRTPMKNKKAAAIARAHSRDEREEDCVLSRSNQNLNSEAPDVPVVARTAR